VGNSLEATIILTLQEAQRDLERGKTLPKFLLQENQTLTLLAGQHTITYPSGFIRENDETRIRFFPPTSSVPRFLVRKMYIDAVQANIFSATDPDTTVEPVAPSVYVMRRSSIDFITVADQNYTLYWDYYKAADPLTSNIENAWLVSDPTTPRLGAPEWLIGEAGLRIARDLGNANAISIFSEMRQAGRAACFGEVIAEEDASGPVQMGANL
jgi:hypothetical protein